MSFDLKLLNGDLTVNSGNLGTVENGDKLIQDVLKIISTPLGSNPAYPGYGCPINSSLIGFNYEKEFVDAVATQQLRSSLELMQKLQLDQLRDNQIVTASEQLAAIENIAVNRDNKDLRYYIIYLTIISKAFQRQTVSFSAPSA